MVGKVFSATAVKPVIEPLLVVKVTVPVPVPEFTFWVGWLTVKPLGRVPVPPGVVTDTSLAPGLAPAAMVMFAVICVAELTVKLFTVTPEPKLTAVAPVK